MNELGAQLRGLIVDAVKRGDYRAAENCPECHGCGEVTEHEVVERFRVRWDDSETWQRVKRRQAPCLRCSGSGLIVEPFPEPEPETYCYGETRSLRRRT